MRSKFLWFVGLTLLLVAAPAFADTVEYCGFSTGGGTCATTAPTGGFLVTADLSTSGSSFTLTMTFTNNSAAAAYLNDFTISLLGGGNVNNTSVNVSSDNLPSGWTESDNAKINNSGPSQCTAGNGFGGWLCASGGGTAANSILLAANGGTVTLTFTGTFTGSVTTPFELMANGGTNNTTGNNSAFTISSAMTTNAPTVIPEPTSLLLLGSGLLSLGVALRKRRSA